MALELALRAIKEAASLGMKSLQLSGGDPLLYPYLVDLIRAGSCYPDVFVFMNSVGSNITLEHAQEIIEAGLGAWNFSVDTLDEAKYSELRGVKDALSVVFKAIETVREAAKSHNEFCINYMTVITRQNFRDIPSLVKHCIDTQVASIYLMNVYGDTAGQSLLTESEIDEFRLKIVPMIIEIFRERDTPEVVQKNAASVMASFFSTENAISNYVNGIYWPNIEDARRFCNVPYYYALVEPDGRVLPCCQIEISHDTDVGNIKNGTLKNLWEGDAYHKFRHDRIQFCRKCPAPRNRTLGLIPKMCRQFND
jgi:MoaA/NifB/PqqE/SkfB family radical SAM enzyme